MIEPARLRLRTTGLLAALLSSLMAGPSGAETIDVPLGGDIQTAIDLAQPYDEIRLEAGTYPLETPLQPRGKYLTLRGAVADDGTPLSILDGGGATRHVRCADGETRLTVFENLVFLDGWGAYAGSISNFGAHPTIRNCHFIGNVSNSDGGAILNNVSRPEIVNCLFRDNVANFGGGAVCNYNSSDAIITSCSFLGNTASTGGAVLNLATSDPVLLDCRFLGNRAENGGGLASRTGSRPTLLASTFADNLAEGSGGGLFVEDAASAPSLAGSTFCRNLPEPVDGTWSDDGGNCFGGGCTLCPIACPGDLDGDGDVDGADLATLLGDWGEAATVGDLDGDGRADGADIALLLGAWGGCS